MNKDNLFNLDGFDNDAPKKRGRKPKTENVLQGTTSGTTVDKRKQSLYFPGNMLDEIKEEAQRLDRSMSWVLQRAWKMSREAIRNLPSAGEEESGDEDFDIEA